jgi:hypothetical protein
MAEPDPDAPTELTFESYWQSHIDDARAGNAVATRDVMHACIRFLKGAGFMEIQENRDPEIQIDPRGCAPKGYVPEPLCTYLLEILEAVMSTPTKEVGKAMGMGKPPSEPRNEKELNEFIQRYTSQANGNYPVTPEKHMEVLRAVMKQMDIKMHSAKRYWEVFEPGVKEFGLSRVNGYSEKHKLEELAKILTHYRSQMSTPVHDDSARLADAHEKALKEVVSRTGMRLGSVNRYWKVFETVLADYDLQPVLDSRNKATFEDLVTFINHYVSIINRSVGDGSIMPGVGDEEILEEIMALMNKDLDSVSRYWDIIETTIGDC